MNAKHKNDQHGWLGETGCSKTVAIGCYLLKQENADNSRFFVDLVQQLNIDYSRTIVQWLKQVLSAQAEGAALGSGKQ